MTKVCRIEGCETRVTARGLCNRHYRAELRSEKPPCSVVGCTKPVRGMDLCDLHLGRLGKFGTPGPAQTLDDLMEWASAQTEPGLACIRPDLPAEWEPFVGRMPALRNGKGFGNRQGTAGGKLRHWKAGEPPCDSCSEHGKAEARRWREENPEKMREQGRRWREENKERYLASQRRSQNMRYHARRADEAIDEAAWATAVSAWGGRCAYGQTFPEAALCDGTAILETKALAASGDPTTVLTLGHVYPINLSTDYANYQTNTVPLCVSCNSSQGGRTLEEWLESKGCPTPFAAVRLALGVVST